MTQLATGRLWLWRKTGSHYYVHEDVLKNPFTSLKTVLIERNTQKSKSFEDEIDALRAVVLRLKIVPASLFFLALHAYIKHTSSKVVSYAPPERKYEYTEDDTGHCVFSVYEDGAFRLSKKATIDVLDFLYGAQGADTHPATTNPLMWDANKWFEEQTAPPTPSLADTWFASIASSLAPPPPPH
jgi:hypothetical protein